MGIKNYNKYSFDAYVTVPLCEKTVDLWHKIGFAPNGITLVHIILKIVVLYMMTLKDIPSVKVASIIAVIAYLDALDGIMARKYDQGTKIGMYLDGVSDLIFWTLFTGIIIFRLKGIIRILLIIGFIIVIVCYLVLTLKNGNIFHEDSEQPQKEDYIWSTVSWNIIPLTFLLGIPLMRSITNT